MVYSYCSKFPELNKSQLQLGYIEKIVSWPAKTLLSLHTVTQKVRSRDRFMMKVPFY